METKPEKPNRILSVLAYLLVLIGPLIVLIFRRKDKFSLYHACQALALVLVAIVVPLGWLVIGWVFTFLSVTAPTLYIVPVAFLLLIPVVRRRNQAERYSNRWSWLDVGTALVWVMGLLFVSWLLLRLFNVTVPELPDTLVWPIGLILFIATCVTLFLAWRAQRWAWVDISLSIFVALALLYGVWLVLVWFAPLVLPLAGQLLLMSGFSIVMAAYITLVVAWIVGMVNALRAQEKPVPVFGGWGERLYGRFTPQEAS